MPFLLISFLIPWQLALATQPNDPCEPAKQVVNRYLDLLDNSKARNEGLIYEKDREGGTDFALVSSKPKVMGCQKKEGDLVVLIGSTVYAETSSAGYHGQYPKLQKIFTPPRADTRELRMHLDEGKWKIDLWDIDPPYAILPTTLSGYESAEKSCATDKEREACLKSVSVDLEKLRDWVHFP